MRHGSHFFGGSAIGRALFVGCAPVGLVRFDQVAGEHFASGELSDRDSVAVGERELEFPELGRRSAQMSTNPGQVHFASDGMVMSIWATSLRAAPDGFAAPAWSLRNATPPRGFGGLDCSLHAR